jgi:RNA polymerase sigma-32 factor
MNTHSADNEIAFYIAAAKRAPELDRDRELELTQRWRTLGDRCAANQLARAHLRLVVTYAVKYRRYGIPVSELVAEGNYGIVQALAKFEPGRGVRFATYASHWVRAQMLRHVIRSWSSVRGESGPMRSRVFFKLRRERVRVTNELGVGDAADQALAERLGMPIEKLKPMLERIDHRDVSLDAKASDAQSLVERLPAGDDQEQSLFEHQVDGSMKSAVENAVMILDPRERYIAERRLMADPTEEQSLGDIARSMKISRERARQLEARAKKKLRAFITNANDPVIHEWIANEITPRSAA